VGRLTCAAVSLLHPDVAVGLSHTGLRVQERHEDAALCAEPGVVAMALLHSIFVILLTQPKATQEKKKMDNTVKR